MWLTLAALAAAGAPPAVGSAAPAGLSGVDKFDRTIAERAISLLRRVCGDCHGAEDPENGLRLDSQEALLKGGKRGPAVVPGAPEASLLIQAVRWAHEGLEMPSKKLPDQDIRLLEDWVRQGAWFEARVDRASPAPMAREADCGKLNLLPVRTVRLAESELKDHLRVVLGAEVVSGEGAPTFRLQGDRATRPEERTFSAADLASYGEASGLLAGRYMKVNSPRWDCLKNEEGKRGSVAPDCFEGPVVDVLRRLFRRPLDAQEREAFQRGYRSVAQRSGPAAAFESVLAAALLAPQTLFRMEAGNRRKDGAQVVLSAEEALDLASFGLLGRPPTVREQAAVLVEAPEVAHGARPSWLPALTSLVGSWTRSPEFTERTTDFVERWMGMDKLRHMQLKPVRGNLEKDLSEPMLAEFREFVRRNLLGDDGGFARFFTAAETRLLPGMEMVYNGRLEAPGRLVWTDKQRKGVLGLAGVLAAHSAPDASDPVHRGMLVRLDLLCEPMPPPAPNADFSKVTVHEGMQTRERYETLARAPACRSCHQIINPPGYVFEGFDQYGRARTEEKGRPVNTSGGLPGFFGKVTYPGASSWRGLEDMATWMAQAPAVRSCFARSYIAHVLAASPVGAEEACVLGPVTDRFLASGHVADLAQDLAASPYFWRRARTTHR